MNSPRRYPRTLQEAFGPHTSRGIHTAPEPGCKLARWLYAAMLIVAILGTCFVTTK